MADHSIKCWPQQFWAIRSGLKTFEYRKNDRGYRVGDTLTIREFDPKTEAFSGAEVRRTITHMLVSGFGLPEGYAVLGLGDLPASHDQAPPELYAARICKGIPADCCDYGVIALGEDIEVCRVWTEENARKIARLLNRDAPSPQTKNPDEAAR